MPKNLGFSDKTLLDWVRPPPSWSKKSEYFLIRIFWIGRDPLPPFWPKVKKNQYFFLTPPLTQPDCKSRYGFWELPKAYSTLKWQSRVWIKVLQSARLCVSLVVRLIPSINVVVTAKRVTKMAKNWWKIGISCLAVQLHSKDHYLPYFIW